MISIKSNVKDFKKTLSKIEKTQIPFVTSRALNSLAFQARKATVTGIERTFKNRSKWYSKGSPVGLEVKTSKKKDLTAEIRFKKANYFVALHEKGGVKKAKSGKLAIPTTHAKKAKRYRISGGAKLAMQQKNTFISKTKKGVTAIFSKKGKRKVSIKPLYLFKEQARVKKFLGFHNRVKRIVKMKFKRTFEFELKRALRTMRY